MENLTEVFDLEDFLSFPAIELSAKQNITNTSSYFKKIISDTDHKILRLYF